MVVWLQGSTKRAGLFARFKLTRQRHRILKGEEEVEVGKTWGALDVARGFQLELSVDLCPF